jgi:hypothetical protein
LAEITDIPVTILATNGWLRTLAKLILDSIIPGKPALLRK